MYPSKAFTLLRNFVGRLLLAVSTAQLLRGAIEPAPHSLTAQLIRGAIEPAPHSLWVAGAMRGWRNAASDHMQQQRQRQQRQRWTITRSLLVLCFNGAAGRSNAGLRPLSARSATGSCVSVNRRCSYMCRVQGTAAITTLMWASSRVASPRGSLLVARATTG